MNIHLQKLINLKLLDGKGFALDLGSGRGEDALVLDDLGYSVTAVDNRSLPSFLPQFFETINEDIRTFNIERDKYKFINCNHVLQFLTYDEADELVRRIAKGLCLKGVASFTFLGYKDEWLGKEGLHFISYEGACSFVDSLGLQVISKSTIEEYAPCKSGALKYWNIHTFVLKRII